MDPIAPHPNRKRDQDKINVSHYGLCSGVTTVGNYPGDLWYQDAKQRYKNAFQIYITDHSRVGFNYDCRALIKNAVTVS